VDALPAAAVAVEAMAMRRSGNAEVAAVQRPRGRSGPKPDVSVPRASGRDAGEAGLASAQRALAWIRLMNAPVG
jgi:hypothetical protein